MQPENEAECLVAVAAATGTEADLATFAEGERVVRGDFLAALLWGEATDGDGRSVTVHRRGLSVRHARISGGVGIRGLGAIDGPAPALSLTHCAGAEGEGGFVLIASDASLLRLDLSRSTLDRIEAEGLRTAGDVLLERTTVRAELVLRRAHIGGLLTLNGAALGASHEGVALWADGQTARGSRALCSSARSRAIVSRPMAPSASPARPFKAASFCAARVFDTPCGVSPAERHRSCSTPPAPPSTAVSTSARLPREPSPPWPLAGPSRLASAPSARRTEPGAEWWRATRFAYALGGLVLVSMAVVTFTGILRRD